MNSWFLGIFLVLLLPSIVSYCLRRSFNFVSLIVCIIAIQKDKYFLLVPYLPNSLCPVCEITKITFHHHCSTTLISVSIFMYLQIWSLIISFPLSKKVTGQLYFLYCRYSNAVTRDCCLLVWQCQGYGCH